MSSGLVVGIKIQFLATSPDGIISDDSLVEIKCPVSAKKLMPEEEAVNIGKIKSCLIKIRQLHLRRNDNYFY